MTAHKEEMAASTERHEWVQPEIRRLQAAGAEDAVGPNADAINPS